MCKKFFYLTCLVLVLSAVSNVSAQLLLRFKLDETSGTIAHDSSGKGNDGIISGDPNWVAGWISGALQFNGNDSITLPASTMGLRSDAGSVALWINMTEVAGDINTVWWGGDNITGGGFGPENEMHIHVEQFVSNIWRGGELGFAGQNNPNFHVHSDPNKGAAPNPPINPILMNDSQWHHITATWGNDDGNVKLYLDGALLHQTAQGTRNFPLSNMYLGQMANGSRTYRGLLDDVQIYGSALTEQEVLAVMAGAEMLSLPAALPEPANEATEVPRDVVFSWMAGDRAYKHNVYFGTVFDDVNQASTADPRGVLVSENQDGTTYDPAGLLEFGQTYYWRVDEVNAPPESAINKGDIWSFTTVNFVVVDDFETYNDLDPSDPLSNRIFLTWIDGYGTTTNGSLIGYAAPPFAEQSIVHSGKQSMPFTYDNDMRYSEAQRSLTGSASDWTREGVNSLTLWFRGYPPYVGSFVEAPPGTYTMTGSGADIWGGSDQFHFAYKELSGAAAIIAKVLSVGNTDPFAKAGVMIRDTLDANSVNVAVFITPANGVRFQYRTAPGGNTERYFTEGITAPYWVRLERSTGGLVRAFYSADGTTWERFSLVQVRMNMPVYIGLAVTSHNVSATCEAKFSNVSFPDISVSPQWTDQDIGMMSNKAEPMYVILNGSAVVYHENPGATQIDTWTEWNINLQSFADKGANLTNINTLGIGFGDRNNPKAGGTGTMYFDDIRLYRPR